jgi:prophage antirepressor-like protein
MSIEESQTIKIYNFESKPIRIVGTVENPYFVVKDVCDVLGLSNVTNAVKNVPEKWRGRTLTKLNTSGGAQDMITINESGLYKLVLRSNKQVAEKFQEWASAVKLFNEQS